IQQLAPAVTGEHYVGDNVQAEDPTQTTHQDNEGTWTFQAYKTSEMALTEGKNEFVGTWTYAKDRAPYTYTFVSSSDKDLPTNISNKISQGGLTPEDADGELGSNIVPTEPTEKTVVVNDGKWVFDSY